MTTHPIPPPNWTHGLPGTIDITRETGDPTPSIRYTATVADIPTPDMPEAGGVRVAVASIAALWIERDPDRAEWIHNAPLVVFGPRNGQPAMHLDPDTAEQLGWALLRAVETITRRPIVTPDHQPCDHPTPIDTGALSRLAMQQVAEDTGGTIEFTDTADYRDIGNGERVLTGIRRITLVTSDPDLANGVADLVRKALADAARRKVIEDTAAAERLDPDLLAEGLDQAARETAAGFTGLVNEPDIVSIARKVADEHTADVHEMRLMNADGPVDPATIKRTEQLTADAAAVEQRKYSADTDPDA